MSLTPNIIELHYGTYYSGHESYGTANLDQLPSNQNSKLFINALTEELGFCECSREEVGAMWDNRREEDGKIILLTECSGCN